MTMLVAESALGGSGTIASPFRSGMTPREVGRRLRLNVRAVYRLIETGEIAAYDVSSGTKRPVWRVSEGQFSDFLDRREKQCTKAHS